MDDRPAVPESVKLQLREEAAFGCCKCGGPVYQYHHIIEHSAGPHCRPEDMMVLCPSCHDEATRGAMSAEEQRRHKAQPYNRRHGHTGGMLKADHHLWAVEAGRIVLTAQGDLIRVDGEALLGISRGPQGGLEFSLALYDQDDQLLVRIERNEWVSGRASLVWELESVFQFLRVRQKQKDIRFEVDTHKKPIQLRASLWRKGQRIEVGPKGLSIGPDRADAILSNFLFQDLCIDIDSTSRQLTFGPTARQQTEEPPMTVLLKHEKQVFEDETVYLAGNAFFGCTFRRCTLIVREAPSALDGCVFDGCVWHLDMLIHEGGQLTGFLTTLVPAITQSLPKMPSPPAG